MIYNDEIYYETYATDGEKCTVNEFPDLESAIEWAEKTGATKIYQIGGSYDELEKCEFCGDWYDLSELNSENYCERCQEAIRGHGFDTPHDRRSRYDY